MDNLLLNMIVMMITVVVGSVYVNTTKEERQEGWKEFIELIEYIKSFREA